MRDLIECLNEYNACVDSYDALQWSDGKEISGLMKNLSVIMSHLEFIRAGYNDQYNDVMVKHDGSVAGAKLKADSEVPELYKLRRIMNAGYRIIDAMRSNLSYIKKEG